MRAWMVLVVGVLASFLPGRSGAQWQWTPDYYTEQGPALRCEMGDRAACSVFDMTPARPPQPDWMNYAWPLVADAYARGRRDRERAFVHAEFGHWPIPPGVPLDRDHRRHGLGRSHAAGAGVSVMGRSLR